MSGKVDYKDFFHPELWQKLSAGQRLEMLQQLENEQARRAGRQPCRIVAEKMRHLGNCGTLNPETWTIKINVEHIRNGAMEFTAIDTVFHEGRHAYQQAAINNPELHHDIEQVRLWQKNQKVYVRGSKNPNSSNTLIVYRGQPVERDAEQYANTERGRLFESIERTYGNVPALQKYNTIVEAEAQHVAAISRDLYGDDFAKRIDMAIQRAYEIKMGLDGEKKIEKERWVTDSRNIGNSAYTIKIEDGAKNRRRQILVENVPAKDAKAILTERAKKEAVKLGFDNPGELTITVEKSKSREKEFQKDKSIGVDRAF